MKPNFFKKIVLFTSIFGLVGCANSGISTISGITNQQELEEIVIHPLRNPNVSLDSNSVTKLTHEYTAVKILKSNKCVSDDRTVRLLQGIRNDQYSFDQLKKLTKESCKLSGNNIIKILNASDLQNDHLYASAACILIEKSDDIVDNITLSKITVNIRGDENRIKFNNCFFKDNNYAS